MSVKRENRFVRLAVIAAVASIALVPMTFYGCGPEWARWDAAQANMYFRQGETDDALYQLRDAIRKSPRDPVLKLTLAQRLIENSQPADAVELADKVLDVFPDNAKAIWTKTNALHELGEFEEALETLLRFNKSQRLVPRDFGLNELAYFRALANKDLPLAKADIEEVIASYNKNYIGWKNDNGLDLGVKSTVLATLVARCCDAEEDALLLISDEIDTINERIVVARSRLTGHVYEEAQDSFPIRQNEGILLRQRLLSIHEKQAVALLACRALLYQDLGQMNRCRSDRREVARLGYDCSEIVASFPDEKTALNSIRAACAVLDTRGYIYSLLPWHDELNQLQPKEQASFSSYENALRDLDIAILCSKVSRLSLDCPFGNSIELSKHDKQRARREGARQNAVLLYHRQTLHERAGNDKLAAMDSKQIRELGYEPGLGLF